MDIWLAYEHFHGHYSSKTVIDSDTDVNSLRKRVNAHYATPRMIDFHRRTKLEIPEDALKSPSYQNSGGGTHYSEWLTLEKSPRLPETIPQ
jgi:hypothetical protein